MIQIEKFAQGYAANAGEFLDHHTSGPYVARGASQSQTLMDAGLVLGAGEPSKLDCDMLVLGIETSCNETAATVVGRDVAGRGRILSNVVRSQWEKPAQRCHDVVVDRTRCALKLARERSDSPALRTLGLVGGVAANARPPQSWFDRTGGGGRLPHGGRRRVFTDNGAMIAWAGLQYLVNGRADPLTFSARARWPLDVDAAPGIGSGRLGVKA